MDARYDLLSEEFLSDPYEFYRHLRDDDPVYDDPVSGHVLVSRYDDVFAAVRDDRFSSNMVEALFGSFEGSTEPRFAPLQRILQDRLLLTDGERHKHVRSLVNHAFTPRRIDAMRPIITAAVDELLDAVSPSGGMDVIHDFADPLPSRMITAILGIPSEDREQFKAWTDHIYEFLGHSRVPVSERACRASASAEQLAEYLRNRITERRAESREDLLGTLVAAEEQGEVLTEGELIANVVGLLNAGHETTTNLIGNGLLSLLRFPDEGRRLTRDLSLWPQAVEELLRFESPIQIIARRTTAEVTIADTPIPAGRRVALMLGAANRDPERFDEPDRLNLSRQNNRHLAFGFGPHYCIGAPLARVVGEVALEALLTRFPGLQLATDRLQWRPYPIFRGLRSLPVTF